MGLSVLGGPWLGVLGLVALGLEAACDRRQTFCSNKKSSMKSFRKAQERSV